MAAFDRLGMAPELVQAVEDMEWLLPTDIQAEGIPLILGGGDVLMAAETGSGKTGAFSLPVLQVVHETLRETSRAPPPLQPRSSSSDAASASAVALVQMNGWDRDTAFAVAPDGLLCQAREEHGWAGGRATHGCCVGGRAYYEVTVTDEGLCRVGWSTLTASRNLGTDASGIGYGGTGKASWARQFNTYGEPFGQGDVIGCLLDRVRNTCEFSRNGKRFGTAFKLPPELSRPGAAVLFPAAVLKNAELKFNFGASPFAHQPAAAASDSASDIAFPSLGAPLDAAHVATASAAAAAAARPSSQRKAGGARTPLALILEPSRELAEQTRAQVNLFKKYLKAPQLQETLLTGGINAKDQLRDLASGCDIVVGTPGRVQDFAQTGKLDLSQVQFFVLDEVDGLLDGGHSGVIDTLYKLLPKESPATGRRLQLVVASATLHSPAVKRLANTLMFHPTWVDLKGQDAVPDTVHHTVVRIDPSSDASWRGDQIDGLRTDGVHARDGKPFAVADAGAGIALQREATSLGVKILKYKYVRAAIDKHKMDQAIIFCRTRVDCDNLETYLNAVGGGAKAMVNEYSCACLHSGRPQQRRDNLEAFKEGRVRFLICTDVAARGIDVRGVPYVINMTLPDEKENYVHRIGRVGRADRMGLAISLVATVEEKVWYHSCPSRGKGCHNTRLRSQGGCCIWYNEQSLLDEVQEHLGCIIPVIDESMEVPVDEFDGKVVYGEKRNVAKSEYKGHADILAPSVRDLADLEDRAQSSFLALKRRKWGELVQ